MRPSGIKRKSGITLCVQNFIADMNDTERLRCFRTANGGELPSHSYTDCCDLTEIRRKYADPGKPQRNAVVESAQSGAR